MYSRTIIGINTQEKQIAIVAVISTLSFLMITSMVASSTLFDQKADAFKFKKFNTKAGSGGNGGNGGNSGITGGNIISTGNGGSGNTGISGGSD
ncbi:MAG TPA: hypothetical protein VFG45_03865 [Candidatus Nitrosocosmicus sp.]|nr:hypothetical protein [Candidatus Nitrosocosmicus sp.]